MEALEIKVVTLTKNEKYIIKHYDTKTPAQIMKATKLNLWDYRGLCSKLSKSKLIITPNTKKKLALEQAKVKANSFTNSGGVLKSYARNMVCDEIKSTNLFGNILSLPFHECKFEKQLIKDVSDNFSFTGVEKEKDTYFKLIKTVQESKLNMSCINGLLIETIRRSRKNDFAHIFADFCGYFEDFYKDIELMFKKDIVQVGGTISITLSNRSFKRTDIISKMNELNPLSLMDGNEIENGIKTFLLKKGKSKYALTQSFTYKDDEKQAMILFILKRVK